MALFFPNFSTFEGKPGLWLEDVYVQPAHRGSGIGKALLAAFLEQARSSGCARAEWSVLDWNENAIRFYESLGARILPTGRLRATDSLFRRG
jgi:GNAT superfamily N-acetyltransferase